MILQQMLFMNLLGRVFEELKNFQSGYLTAAPAQKCFFLPLGEVSTI
jgi:hypothetical protein